MSTLHLTQAERNIFHGLSERLRDGWEVTLEARSAPDHRENREIRVQLLRLHDPKLLRFQKKAAAISDPEELAELVADTDLAEVSDADLAELFFALGPATLTKVIGVMLQMAKTDQDLQGIAALTAIRDALLFSLPLVR